MKYREFLAAAPIQPDGSWMCPICPKKKRVPLHSHRGNHFGRNHTRKWKTKIVDAAFIQGDYVLR